MAIEPQIQNWDCDTVDNAKDDGGNFHNVAPGVEETTCRPASAGAWVDDVLEGADDAHIVAVNTGDGQYNGNFSPAVLHDSFKILWLKLNALLCYAKDIACQFTVTTLAEGEEVVGYLARISTATGGCRTALVEPASSVVFFDNEGFSDLLDPSTFDAVGGQPESTAYKSGQIFVGTEYTHALIWLRLYGFWGAGTSGTGNAPTWNLRDENRGAYTPLLVENAPADFSAKDSFTQSGTAVCTVDASGYCNIAAAMTFSGTETLDFSGTVTLFPSYRVESAWTE